jgi:hypothetical protein
VYLYFLFIIETKEDAETEDGAIMLVKHHLQLGNTAMLRYLCVYIYTRIHILYILWYIDPLMGNDSEIGNYRTAVTE